MHFINHRGKYRRGFTLLELLVVIGIIALLAAILFPVFARARENARRASCQSNLKQLMLGVVQYTQDFDERFPLSVAGVGISRVQWPDLVMPYVKSTQIFFCPSHKTTYPATPLAVAYDYPITWTPLYISYGANDWVFDPGYNFNTLAVMKSPARVVLISDWINSNAAGNGAANSITATTSASQGSGTATDGDTGYKRGRMRHLWGGNYAFADGHVKWFKAPEPWHGFNTQIASSDTAGVYGYWYNPTE